MHLLLSLGILNVFIKKDNKIKNTYKTISLLSFFIMIGVLIIPSLSSRFGLSRFRWVFMLFLSPYIVIGYNTFTYILYNIKNINLKDYNNFNILSNKRKYVPVISLLLIFYFLFNVGLINYAFNDKPLSFTFDTYRQQTSTDKEIVSAYFAQIKPEWDVYSAIWLSTNANPESNIYSDYISAWHVIISHGLMDNSKVNQFSNNTIFNEGNYIYTSYLNNIKNTTAIRGYGKTNRILYNTSILYPVFNINNKIYSNGNSELYFCISNDQNKMILKEEK